MYIHPCPQKSGVPAPIKRIYTSGVPAYRTKCIIHNINYNPYNPYSQKHSIYYIASTHVAICKVKPMKLCLIAGKL